MTFSFKTARLAGAVALTAATLAFGAGAASSAPHTIHNIVLVHGAFTDETSWDKVAAILKHKGFKVTEVANPTTSLADDVAATRAVLARQKGPVVLVGHSWGGMVIGEAGDDPKVKALVYIAAFAPDKGETLGALAASGPQSEGQKALRPDANGLLALPSDVFAAEFAGDLPADQAAELAKHQVPLNPAVFGTPATVAAWHSKPTFYAISADDRMIPPQAEAFFAKRMNATTVTIQSSHASPASHPADVADLIAEAAGK